MTKRKEELAKESAARWLRRLICAHAVSTVTTLISMYTMGEGWFAWVNQAAALTVVICLFQLAPANKYYKNAAWYRACMLAVGLIQAMSDLTAALSPLSTVFMLLATYEEYTAHGELVKDLDAGLSGKWHKLFIRQIIWNVVFLIIAIPLAFLLTMFGFYGADVISVVGMALQVVFTVVHIRYLKRAVRLLQD